MNGLTEPGDGPGSSESSIKIFERQFSKISLCETDDDPDEEKGSDDFVPSPLVPLKVYLERDKEDESLRRWKEQLLGCVDYCLNGEHIEPEVTVLSLGIISDGSPKITLSLPLCKSSNDVCFTLKEGSNYSMEFTFVVHHNIVSGLAYVNTVWKGGLQVSQTRGMLGTFSPQQEPYMHVLEEDQTPTGILARGTYTAKTKFVDDDGRCHLEVDFSFEIQKD